MKLLSFCLATAFSISAFGQLTILESTHAPQVGDSQEMKSIQSGSFDYSPSGPNQTWDFSNATVTATNTYNYLSISDGAKGSSYPAATIVEEASGAENYYKVTSNGYNIVGQYQAGVAELDFTSDEREFIRYPFTYGDQYNSTFSGVVNSQGVQLNRGGTIKIISDGYGTLKLPGGVTFNNALRVNTISTYSDTYFGYEIGTYIDSVITWYVTGIRGFVANYSVAYTNGTLALAQGTYRNNLSASSALGIQTNVFSIAPNPANEVVNVYSPSNNNTVTFYNSLGAVEKQVVLSAGQHSINIDSFSPGVYLVQYASEGESKTLKLLVQ